MQRGVRRPGRTPARRPPGRPQGRRPAGPGRLPGGKPARRPGRQRALRPFDGRTAVFVAGSTSLHRFITSRLSSRTDIWVAKPLSARNYAQGTVFRMKPDVTIVDLDTVWNPAGLPLARAVTAACPKAHVILVAPEGFSQGQTISAESQSTGWSAILHRKSDNGERLIQAIAAGLNGERWIDPALASTDWRQTATESGGPDDGDGRSWEQSAGLDALERAEGVGSLTESSVTDQESRDWQKRARRGIDR